MADVLHVSPLVAQLFSETPLYRRSESEEYQRTGFDGYFGHIPFVVHREWNGYGNETAENNLRIETRDG